ncbi:MAG TPA: hypothetical protein DC017_12785 [Candidatus Wallbacteria bacterium]|nr:hypothetical protein [Candidatus Wallbacteria bacterium]
MFDRVLLDSPCSGLGLMRSRIELKYRFNGSDLTAMPKIQKPLLANVARLLKTGGYLLYCTCTINKKENSEMVSEFLNANKNFSVVSLKDRMDRFGYEFNILDGDYEMMQILPDAEGSEGFFYALMRKN